MPVPVPKTTPVPDHFILPDLVSHCSFPLAYHPHGDAVAAESVRWLDEGCPELSPKARKALYGLQAGELTAYCYPFCSTERLRVVSDFMNYLFHLDNVSDGMMRKGTEELADCVMNALWFPDRYMPTTCEGKDQPIEEVSAGKLARDYWTRCTRDAKPGPQARFKESLELFFEAVHQQARDRDSKLIPDLDSYISVRRDTSGCKPVFDLIEYAMDIDLPEHVVRHPIIQALNQGANDLVTWSNDIFSYNVEQARGDTHNMIVILMELRGCDLQTAIDFVGELCKQTVDTFMENQRNVPSFGPRLDRDVALYVQGLQDWIVGSLHWSFMSERYFGKSGAAVKKHRIVKLLPRRPKALRVGA
ncbi:terpenoid synthase [Dichomitus squalens]|uniref:Terpene synthase n=1 Tax=Dichomitus squalens TaxID=114155 RepID=A0A4Q9N483_9APHY|nr:terpenoid synthase [Dichomitus squalens]